MEVAVGLDPAVVGDDRVVDGAASSRPAIVRGVVDGVARGAVHLRRSSAASTRPARACTSGSRCEATIGESGEERPQVRGGCRLAELRPQRHEVGGEDGIRAELALDRHGRGDVGRVEQHRQVVQREQQHPEHAVGAVDEGEALLLAQLERSDGCRGAARRRPATSVAGGVAHVPLAHRGERDVRERREVARAAERAVLAHDRGDAGVEHRGVRLGDDRAHAGAAGRERLQPQQLSARTTSRSTSAPVPAACERIRLACSCSAALGRDERRRERAEAGRDAVVRLGVVGEALDERAGCRDPLERGGVELDARAVAGDGDDVVGAQRVRADGDDARWCR